MSLTTADLADRLEVIPGDKQAAWTTAFIAAQQEFPPIKKTKTATIPMKSGGSYKYTYADLGDILDAVVPILNKHGLALTQSVVTVDGKIGATTRIFHTGGYEAEFGPLLLGAGNDAQAGGSAATYAKRYSLQGALGISTEEDDDGRGAVVSEVSQVDEVEQARLRTNALKARLYAESKDKEVAADTWAGILDYLKVAEPLNLGQLEEVEAAMVEEK